MNTLTQTKRKINDEPNWNAIISATKAGIMSAPKNHVSAKPHGQERVRKDLFLTDIEKICATIKNDLDWHSAFPETKNRPAFPASASHESASGAPARLVEKWWLIG